MSGLVLGGLVVRLVCAWESPPQGRRTRSSTPVRVRKESDAHCLSCVSLTPHYSPFVEAQRGQATCPGSHSEEVGLNTRSHLAPRAIRFGSLEIQLQPQASCEARGHSPEQEESRGLSLGLLKPLTGSAGAVSLKAWSPDQQRQQHLGALRSASAQDPTLCLLRRLPGDSKA